MWKANLLNHYYYTQKSYGEKKIETNILRNIVKGLLYLRTKHVRFAYNDKISIQIDGVAFGSRLTDHSFVAKHF